MKLIKLKFLSILLFLGFATNSQNITYAEYFYDSDPGVGNGTSFNFTPGDTVNFTFYVPITGLSEGFHTVFIRFKNDNAVWSLYEGRPFYIQPPPRPEASALADMEYFYDTDPGVGNGIPFTINPDDTINITENLPIEGLSKGFHTAFIRFKNGDGNWGLYEGRPFYIQPLSRPEAPALADMEYFYDTDPGIGNGTPFNINSDDTVNFTENFPTNGLSEGFHTAFIRFKNGDGNWGLYEGRPFYIQPAPRPEASPIKSMEYFVDTDPGVGYGIPISIPTSDTLNLLVHAYINVIDTGMHYIYLRVKDANGIWSLAQRDTFQVYAAYLDLKAYLEGAYNGSDMNTHLNPGDLPLNQPYNTPPWNYNGTESVVSIPNDSIVDWVMVELRDAPSSSQATGSTIIEQRAVFIIKNGKIADLDGTNIPRFNVAVNDSLYVIIWHRNHLGIMSANSVTKASGVYTYNFTTGAGQAYGGANGHKEIASGVWGMFGGDGNGDGNINTNDKTNVWSVQAGTDGYISGDFNMDGMVQNQDKNDVWVGSNGNTSQVPE